MDDQDDVRDMLFAMLTRMGAKVVCAKNGKEAVEIIVEEHEQIDLVITDQNMPKVTGLEIVDHVEKSALQLPFILISGYSVEKLQNLMSKKSYIKAVLRKPVSQKELKLEIAKVLRLTKKVDQC